MKIAESIKKSLKNPPDQFKSNPSLTQTTHFLFLSISLEEYKTKVVGWVYKHYRNE